MKKFISYLLSIIICASMFAGILMPKKVEASQTADWLTTDGDKIVDMNGNEVWLTGVNWFGYNTGTNIFDGVWSCSMSNTLQTIANRGFNLLRVPISAELILNWKNGTYPAANYNSYLNPDLNGKNSLQIFDYALEVCDRVGLKVMIDIHSIPTDPIGHLQPLWSTSSISVDQYLMALDWISARYANNDTVVAYDLKNEPHTGDLSQPNGAIWNNSQSANNWKYTAERAGNVVLNNNPHALIVVEGIEVYPRNINSNNFTSSDGGDYYYAFWGANLRGVRNYPVNLGSAARNKQVVYSPHDYGPSVSQQSWFHNGFTYQSLIDEYWYDTWLYIDAEHIAPILIGEWGGFMTDANTLTWMTHLRTLIGNYHLNYTFWCFNANSGDTGGLVADDFTTWDETKYSFVEQVLWQDSNGRFIGLDHDTPLGNNGLSLNQYYPSTPTNSPTPTSSPTPTPTPIELPMNPNGVGDFIDRLYQTVQNRPADNAGKTYWVNSIRNGRTAGDVAFFFLTGPEFTNRGLSNTDFVNTMYQTFFDHAPDTNGRNYWLGKIQGGMSRAQVVREFINSLEWANLCLTYGVESGGLARPNIIVTPNDYIRDFARRLYEKCLGRTAENNGLNYWAYRLANRTATGTGAAYDFFFSAEFTNKHLPDSEFITRLYRTMMGREPDTAGLNYWIRRLSNGVSRIDAFNNFAASTEFGIICSDYGIAR